jgi:hypothetical protein
MEFLEDFTEFLRDFIEFRLPVHLYRDTTGPGSPPQPT